MQNLSQPAKNESIDIDVNIKDGDGYSALHYAIYSLDSYNTSYIISMLFRRGYKLSDNEKELLYGEFKKQGTNNKIHENITRAIIRGNLESDDLIIKALDIEKLLLTLISFKTKRVVGYRLNHTALANNFLHHHREFGMLFIKALKKYGYYENLRAKESFIKKENALIAEMSYQENKYDDVVSSLFPELYE